MKPWTFDEKIHWRSSILFEMSKFWFYCIQYKIDSSEKSICDVLTKIDTILRKRDFQRQNIKYKRKVDCIFTTFTYGPKLDRKIAVSKNTCWDKISSISRILCSSCPTWLYLTRLSFHQELALYTINIFGCISSKPDEFLDISQPQQTLWKMMKKSC